MAARPKNYNSNVFINCPFDKGYKRLFDAVSFALISAGFIPRSAREANNAADVRIEKIFRIISECKYGVHDISETRLDRNNLPRFNMPLELGLDLACRKFGESRHRDKRILVLDHNDRRYVKFISDIRGQDIDGHNRSAEKIILAVRNWIATESKRNDIPGGKFIFAEYKKFQKALPLLCTASRKDVGDLTFGELGYFIGLWLQEKA